MNLWPLSWFGSAQRAELLVTSGTTTERIPLTEDRLVIGRAERSERTLVVTSAAKIGSKVAIEDSPVTKGISRQHCVLMWNGVDRMYKLTVAGTEGIFFKGVCFQQGHQLMLANKETIKLPCHAPTVSIQILYN